LSDDLNGAERDGYSEQDRQQQLMKWVTRREGYRFVPALLGCADEERALDSHEDQHEKKSEAGFGHIDYRGRGNSHTKSSVLYILT
jgi:hypothetical protein